MTTPLCSYAKGLVKNVCGNTYHNAHSENIVRAKYMCMHFPLFLLPGEVGEEKRGLAAMIEGKGPNNDRSPENQMLLQPGDHVPPF